LLVAIGPLVVISVISYNQYKQAFREGLIQPTQRLTVSVKRSMEFFLEERRAAMNFIVRDRSFAELADQEQLAHIFRNMKEAFGGIIDLGLIDSNGVQGSYIGPYELRGINYHDEDWFHEVRVRDVYISDVFMGYRNFPHFVIAVRHASPSGSFYVLRATLDMENLARQVATLELRPSSDAFVINREGILQTNTRSGGKTLEKSPVPVPDVTDGIRVSEESDPQGRPCILGYAYIEESPFIFILVDRPDVLMQGWNALRNRLFGFLGISIVLIVLLVIGTSSYVVSSLCESDRLQAAAVHQLEYSNKLASIGRLGAGVAHEINNPLAIINEKAGLLKDLLAEDQQIPNKEKLLKLVDSVLYSVERCSRITHQLLGFAKRIDVQRKPVDLHALVNEVLGFLGKEAEYRSITISVDAEPGLPTIESDPGQIEQVLLNIITNALEALDVGGKIAITLREKQPGAVEVAITDDGPGIPEDVLPRIFEPFFSTKKEHGTGLGLSITFGIVQKLGGQLDVSSKVGHGTSLVVTLPVHTP
jgi:two-component system, NtrC family, sensor kinase